MSEEEPEVEGSPGFQRDVAIDEPGIVGARWWHASLIAEDASLRRRAVLKGLAVVGGVALLGYGVAKAAGGSSRSTELRDTLAMQKQYGWDFGARGAPLVFDGTERKPFDRGALQRLASALRPKRFAAFHVSTLLDSLDAAPTDVLTHPRTDDDSGPVSGVAAPAFKRLSEVVVPSETTAMRRAYLVGEAFARLATNRSPKAALLVDLPGAEAAAFAAGACSVFEPVLLFDNWPHPRGVVRSHMTLAALAYYQPRFEKQAAARSASDVMPVFVVDRDRAAAYSEESDRFDNRYFARMASAAALAALGVEHLFYVMPHMTDLPEPDDLNDALSSMSAALAGAIVARPIALSEFSGTEGDASPPDGERPLGSTAGFYYGGSPASDASLWVNYPWVPEPSPPPPETYSSLKSYVFTKRASAVARPTGNFGKVAVLLTGGIVVGSLLRRGSMNRASGGWGG